MSAVSRAAVALAIFITTAITFSSASLGSEPAKIEIYRFSKTATKNDRLPKDAVKPGGKIKACKVKKLVVYINYYNMTDGLTTSAYWYHNGKLIYTLNPFPWDIGSDGGSGLYISRAAGLRPGKYKVEIIYNDETLASGSVRIVKKRC